MDNNKLNKVKDFLKKEGFYVILFVCLCVVAITAAITINNNNKKLTEKGANEDSFSLNDNEDNDLALEGSTSIDKDNADRVENTGIEEDQTEIVENNTEVDESIDVSSDVIADESAEVSSNSVATLTFTLPLEGTISRQYNENEGMVEIAATGNINASFVSKSGIDISTSVGTVVKAAADGQVEEISKDTTYGTYIVLAHSNGLKTKYTNLSDDVAVVVGDTVLAGAEIGTVGNTSEIFTTELFGDVLNLQVFDSNGEEVNPQEYFSF